MACLSMRRNAPRPSRGPSGPERSSSTLRTIPHAPSPSATASAPYRGATASSQNCNPRRGSHRHDIPHVRSRGTRYTGACQHSPRLLKGGRAAPVCMLREPGCNRALPYFDVIHSFALMFLPPFPRLPRGPGCLCRDWSSWQEICRESKSWHEICRDSPSWRHQLASQQIPCHGSRFQQTCPAVKLRKGVKPLFSLNAVPATSRACGRAGWGILVRASKARSLLKWGGRRRFILLRGPGCSRVLPYLPNVIHSFALMFLPPSSGGQDEPSEQLDHGRRVCGQSRDRQCNKNFTDRHIALLSKGAARARTLLARARHSIWRWHS